ncbi:glutamate synthase, NADH/NADPH, small subunit 2 [Catenovulum agarivorans DS-2]|uniref:Glutamate synthase, NADH/NADPH, small subunit 2 n=1 Tax=Catenovulum agarivorans DS-2 TaxID=1328313 RepID=W7QCT7_9ALTE|nr:sugar porter family MFS transporter [Catenovulum agarivorans]EWH10709.1 glutamate synthase, NADH/NADPH, small subunit 2 [Catenovulum agarivorans DS-2]
MKYRLNPSIVYSIFVAFGGFIFGVDTALISGTLDFIVDDFSLDELALGNLVSAPALGVLLALVLTGWFCDKYGRKTTLLVIALMYFISAVCSAFAQSYTQLFFARMLGGMAFTSLSLASMYIGEIAPAKQRGRLVSLNQILIVTGVVFAQLFNYLVLTSGSAISWLPDSFVVKSNEWRWMLGFEIVPAFIWLVLISFIPESPRWLIAKDKLAEAKRVLAKIHPDEDVDAELNKLKLSIQTEIRQPSLWTRLLTLTAKKYRLIMLIGITFACVQPLTGINPILYFAPMIFAQTGVSAEAAYAHTVLIGLVGFFTTLWTVLYIERYGRRFLVNLGLLMSVAGLLVCSWAFSQATYLMTTESLVELQQSFAVLQDIDVSTMVGVVYTSEAHFVGEFERLTGQTLSKPVLKAIIGAAITVDLWLVLFGILTVVGAFHISIGPVMWVVFSDIVPTQYRAIMIPLFAFVTSIVSYLMQTFFPWMLASWGADGVFASYAAASAVGFVLLYKLLPETTGKAIEDIELMLTRRNH